MKRLKPHALYLLILLFAGWCFVQFRADFAKLSLEPVLAAPHLIVVGALLSLFNYGLRIIRWRAYLGHLGHVLTYRFAALTFTAGFAFTLSPGKVGEMARARYYRGLGIPFSHVAAAFFMERLMDLLAMVTVALLAVATLSASYQWLLWGTVAAMGALLFLLAVLPWTRLERWIARSPVIPGLFRKAGGGVCRTFDSARALLRPDMLIGGFLLGVLAWGAEGVGLKVISAMTPAVTLELSAALGIYSVAIIVGALSFLPGGLGSTEAVMVALLVAAGYPMADALLLTLVCRLLTLWLAVGLGWLSVLVLRRELAAGASGITPLTPITMKNDMPDSPLPLCVDLDGTLIHSDLLLESFLLLVKRNPLYFFRVPFWLLQGKAVMKAEIARRVTLQAATLPYHQELLAWLVKSKAAGKPLWLGTASNEKLAQAVADHLGIFDGVLASDGRHNLSGTHKAARLVERFGEKGFDYCGNEGKDLAIWKHSRGAIVVHGGAALEAQAGKVAKLLKVFPSRGNRLHSVFRALRPHQWAKNVLIFVPLLTAHRLGETGALMAACWAFLAFGLCASSVYLLNDMLDLEADRLHPRKSKRPFAAGQVSLWYGFALTPLLLVAAFAIALSLPVAFLVCLAGYYVLTLAYSFYLKRALLLDTISLAALYTSRIVAGAAAVSVTLSFWLLLFSVFLFLSLALVKRYAELEAMRRRKQLKAAGRGYHIEDLPVLQSFGAAAGYLSVLVLALYINSPDVAAMYKNPKVIWFLCALMLYWISRIWMKTHRGEMHDDPVIFALRDRVSLGIGLLAAITVVVAS
ncbi:MAG: UbiA family prenyltransferase [Methylococcaceae bacterium]|nr:UbiA family prenyltransferase [Methylococcaceae bacterium]